MIFFGDTKLGIFYFGQVIRFGGEFLTYDTRCFIFRIKMLVFLAYMSVCHLRNHVIPTTGV